MSNRQANVEPVSDAVKVKLALPLVAVPEGPPLMVVSGAVVSGGGTATVHVRVAGDPSVLPAASVARTSKVCEPFASPEYALGEEQLPQLPASSRHANVDPVSDEEKVKFAAPLVAVPEGPESIWVSGGSRSGGGGSGGGGGMRCFFLPRCRGLVPARSSIPSAIPSRSVSWRSAEVFDCFTS